MKEALTCKEGSPNPADKIAKMRKEIGAAMTKELKGIKMEWKSSETRKSETVKKGDKKGECTINMEMERAKVKWHFTMTKDGKSEEESEGVTLMRFADKGWFLVDM